MSRKGVSAEEKRTRMLELLYEKKEFFQLKDLEKIAPKAKGIVAQSVKDVVQNLVDDGLINTDKIGGSTYFWAFPSDAKKAKKRKLNELEANYDRAVKKLSDLQKNLEQAEIGRGENPQRNEILAKISHLQNEETELDDQLKQFKNNNSEDLDQMKKDIDTTLEAVNRWTDNIFTIRTWANRKFFIENATLNKQFGIPADLDYLE